MVEKHNFLIFKDKDSMNLYFKKILNPKLKGNIEFEVFEKFRKFKLLFTAEHANAARIYLKNLGENAYVGLGDKNTDILAKIGAIYSRSAYLISYINRRFADFSRNPLDLGKNLRLIVNVKNSFQTKTFVEIHKDKSLKGEIERYHSIISSLDPKIIVSVHGMHKKNKYDAIFGFGPKYKYLGNKKEAFKFKLKLQNYLDEIFNSLGLKNDLEIGIAKLKYSGSLNYVLEKHVLGKNNKIGMQLELNSKGRFVKKTSIPSIKYQIFIQALSRFLYEEYFNLERKFF